MDCKYTERKPKLRDDGDNSFSSLVTSRQIPFCSLPSALKFESCLLYTFDSSLLKSHDYWRPCRNWNSLSTDIRSNDHHRHLPCRHLHVYGESDSDTIVTVTVTLLDSFVSCLIAVSAAIIAYIFYIKPRPTSHLQMTIPYTN